MCNYSRNYFFFVFWIVSWYVCVFVRWFVCLFVSWCVCVFVAAGAIQTYSLTGGLPKAIQDTDVLFNV